MYTMQEFHLMQSTNNALAEKIIMLEAKISKLEREKRNIIKEHNVIDKYYNKRVNQALSLLESGSMPIPQISGMTGFSIYQINMFAKNRRIKNK